MGSFFENYRVIFGKTIGSFFWDHEIIPEKCPYRFPKNDPVVHTLELNLTRLAEELSLLGYLVCC